MHDPKLEADFLRARLGAYVRLTGGYPIPLAGAAYWAALAWAGTFLPLKTWIVVAFIGSGAIFPMAVLFAKIAGNPFLSDKSEAGTLLAPAFVSMLIFWPSAVAAFWTAPELVSLILAIGMSVHWPVIGWSFGRSALFSAHALVRAVAVFALWLAYPDQRLVLIPAAVTAIYLLTVLAILIDCAMVRRRLRAES